MKDGLRRDLRTIRWSAWLGWQMESNWTNPWLFAIYSVVKPISATLILVFMYVIILGDVATDPVLFSYMYVGNAFYMFVAQVMFGVAYVVQEDRERFKTLKQVYIAPISFFLYVIGRALSKMAVTALAVVITLVFGVVALDVAVDLDVRPATRPAGTTRRSSGSRPPGSGWPAPCARPGRSGRP